MLLILCVIERTTSQDSVLRGEPSQNPWSPRGPSKDSLKPPRGLPHPQHQTIHLFSLTNLAPWLGGGRTIPEHKAPQGSSKGSPRLAEDTPTRQSSTCIFPNLSNLIWGSSHSRTPSPRRPFQRHPQASQRTLPPPTPFPPPHLTKHIFFVLC